MRSTNGGSTRWTQDRAGDVPARTGEQLRSWICTIARTSPADWSITAFSTWSPAKLRDRLLREGVVAELSTRDAAPHPERWRCLLADHDRMEGFHRPGPNHQDGRILDLYDHPPADGRVCVNGFGPLNLLPRRGMAWRPRLRIVYAVNPIQQPSSAQPGGTMTTRRVWRYRLAITSRATITMPADATVLTIGNTRDGVAVVLAENRADMGAVVVGAAEDAGAGRARPRLDALTRSAGPVNPTRAGRSSARPGPQARETRVAAADPS